MKILAIDIGAESGRAILGVRTNDGFSLQEIHRFRNVPIQIGHTLRWDLDALLRGVFRSVQLAGEDIASVGIDTWAIDFVLLDKGGKPFETPYHYRDARTDGVMEKAFQVISRSDIYAATGIQFLPFNTIYQLYSMVLAGSDVLHKAHRFQTIPDYLTHVLAGFDSKKAGCEFTNATTTQCFNPTLHNWDDHLLSSLSIPRRIFPEVVEPGTVVGRISQSGAKVIVPACHDTGSAVAAVPAEGSDYAWISSGTWSIMGIESPMPIITVESCEASFTNEGGLGGAFRFCKNVMGLWILQQCRAQWEAEGLDLDYAELVRQAEAAEPNTAIFDPDDALFLKPGDMPSRINAWLKERSLPIPKTPGQMTRAILESLAEKYKSVFGQLQTLSGRKLNRIHVIGGGSQIQLLNRLTSEYCGVPVIPGPVEATAIGNLLVQMLALGELGSIEEGRRLNIRTAPI